MSRAVEKRFGRRALIPLDERRWGRVRRETEHRRRAVASGNPQSAIRQALLGPPSGDRLLGLDLLRLLAALAVVIFHFGYAGPRRGTMDTGFAEIAACAKYGYLGVDLFFLISGYVITASAHGRNWAEFGWARFLRLYPGHVVCMTTTALVLLMLGPLNAPVTLTQWIANLTMFSPALGQPFMDGAYWSIVIELVFYFWVGVFLAFGLLERRLHLILGIWLAGAFINEALLQTKILRLVFATEYAGLFVSGIIIQRWRAGDRTPVAMALLCAAFCLSAFHAIEAQRVFERLYGDRLDLIVQFVLHIGVYALLFGGLAASRWVPASPWVLTVGGLTYPLYLVHQNAGHRIIDSLAPVTGPWLALAIALAAALLFSWLVWRFAEPAGRKLLKAAKYRLSCLSPAPGAPATR